MVGIANTKCRNKEHIYFKYSDKEHKGVGIANTGVGIANTNSRNKEHRQIGKKNT